MSNRFFFLIALAGIGLAAVLACAFQFLLIPHYATGNGWIDFIVLIVAEALIACSFYPVAAKVPSTQNYAFGAQFLFGSGALTLLTIVHVATCIAGWDWNTAYYIIAGLITVVTIARLALAELGSTMQMETDARLANKKKVIPTANK